MFDFNCDIGEGIGNDEAIIPFITSANIACGFHAGDKSTMKRAIELCLKHNVKIGVHPSFPDRENFGITDNFMSLPEAYNVVFEQILILNEIAIEMGASLHHVKCHGSLYNQSARAKPLAAVVSLAIKDTGKDLAVYGLSNSYLISEAKKIGLKTYQEAFADRTYADDGRLTPKGKPGAYFTTVKEISAQINLITKKGYALSTGGKQIPIVADTFCIQNDGAFAQKFAKAIHKKFIEVQEVV